MRIVLYSRTFPPAVGGMERFAEDLAMWLAGAGQDVTVVTLSPEASGREALPYRLLRRPGPGTLIREIRRADVVHVNGASLRGIASSLASRQRPLVTHHGHQTFCPIGLAWSPVGTCRAGPTPGPCRVCPSSGPVAKARAQAHRRGAALAAANVCVSGYLMGRLGVPRAERIYNPVAERVFRSAGGGQEEDGLIAFAGRLVAEKGLDLLLRALVHVPDARLEIAGDGPMRAAWGALVELESLENRVKFLGPLAFEGIADLYQRASAVCVPSAWNEPFGYAAAEAMASGRPAVATPRGALVELLEGGRGFLAQEATPKALASSLDEALRDASARRLAGEQARTFAQRELMINIIGPRYLAAYQRAGR